MPSPGKRKGLVCSSSAWETESKREQRAEQQQQQQEKRKQHGRGADKQAQYLPLRAAPHRASSTAGLPLHLFHQ